MGVNCGRCRIFRQRSRRVRHVRRGHRGACSKSTARRPGPLNGRAQQVRQALEEKEVVAAAAAAASRKRGKAPPSRNAVPKKVELKLGGANEAKSSCPGSRNSA